ncbi:MAG: hypothetical protein ABEI75_03605 [Halobaculum sp.]
MPTTPADTTEPDRDRETVPFSDLARAAYCPRQLYYERRTDRTVPEAARRRITLAFRYPELRRTDRATLAEEPVALDPDEYRERVETLADRDDWSALVDPSEDRFLLAGKDCHGRVHKLLPGAPPTPVIVSPGAPPDEGVWEPQTVRAVAAAKALAWTREEKIPRAIVEYPTHAVVRSVRLTVRKTAAYRRALRTARSIDGPPSRLADSAKCDPCPHREECGVETRSLRSRLGL